MYFAIRLVIALAVLVPYQFIFGGGGSTAQIFLVALIAFGLGHLTVYFLRRARGDSARESYESSPLVRIGLTALVAVGSLGFLVYSGRASSSGYRMVDKLMVEPARWVDKEMKIHGFVEPGSIDVKIENQETLRTFTLQNKGKQVKVHHIGPVPDTFKDASEVVAKGTLTRVADGSYMFEASELMAKCPSKYEGAESQKNFNERPTLN